MSKIETNTIEPSTGTTLTLGASGDFILKPNQPAFKAFNDDAAWKSFGASATETLMDFPDTNLNIGNCYDTTNKKFVAPIAGVYAFDFQWYTDDTSSRGLIYKNSESIPEAATFNTRQGTTLHTNLVIQLSVNDEIKVYGYVGTSNPDDWYARKDRSFFQGYLIG